MNNTLKNILWLLLGGLLMAYGYFMAGALLFCTLVGIPLSIPVFKVAILCLWPFGAEVKEKEDIGCLTSLFCFVWYLFPGIPLCFVHMIFGFCLCVTIVGFPLGRKHFDMAKIALCPYAVDVKMHL